MGNTYSPSDVKQRTILEAATKRFAHFGMAKTTMNEIARDISVSKALLYYYYPNKQALYESVMEYVIDIMSNKVREVIEKKESALEAMHIALEERMAIINEYYNLFQYPYTLRKGTSADMQRIHSQIEERELELLSGIMRRGVERGEFELNDVKNTARLLLYALAGVRISLLKGLNNPIFPSKSDFEKILIQQKILAEIFIRGLKK